MLTLSPAPLTRIMTTLRHVFVLTLSLSLSLSPVAFSHSMMTHPQSTSPRVCRLGGNPNPGTCPGPCDLTAIEGRFANFDSPDNPAARYSRGQRVTIKYQRNNHGPGGFVRHTLVPISQMMNKAVHTRNAFEYSCFGATPVIATAEDRKVDKWGFSMVGNDGKTTRVGYYKSTITIPSVVPDGKYVLGWVWYGGTGGETSDTPYTEEPWWKGYFGDYWSCSFVEVSGGAPLQREYYPVFHNDMQKFSADGCMAANDAPGVCIREPCVVEGSYRPPRPFRDGAVPGALTPEHFGGASADAVPGGAEPPAPAPAVEPATPSPAGAASGSYGDMDGRSGETRLSSVETMRRMRACMCLASGARCGGGRAKRTGRVCRRRIAAKAQPALCRKRCCEFCALRFRGAMERRRRKVCAYRVVRATCAK